MPYIPNSGYKEDYSTRKIQIDIIFEKYIKATIGTDDNIRLISIPRSAISDLSQKEFSTIMNFPVIRHVQIARWLLRKEDF